MYNKWLWFICLLLSSFLLMWCQQSKNTVLQDQVNTDIVDQEINPNEIVDDEVIDEEVDVASESDMEKITAYFEDDVLLEDITLVDCTLSDGTQTSCYNIVTQQWVTEDDIWPRCPKNITDGAEAWWIWLESWEVYDVDGEFIKNLAVFYEDDSWQLYDEETWEIYVTDTKEAFEWAAKPDVEEEYKNHCVYGLLSYLDEIPTITYVIPIDPQKAETTQGTSDPFWLAFNWVRFDAPAPVAAILAANTIAAFDDCGWHVNPNVWYHYHAETWCAPRVTENEDHEELIWLALDGFEIYEHNDALTDLDTCGWHTDDVRWYHYHISAAWDNQNLWCLSGGYGCALSEDGTCDASASDVRGGPPGQGGERPWRPAQ